eukprot:6145908-Pleurochrysis_carterae.AAC.1
MLHPPVAEAVVDPVGQVVGVAIVMHGLRIPRNQRKCLDVERVMHRSSWDLNFLGGGLGLHVENGLAHSFVYHAAHFLAQLLRGEIKR